MENIVKEIKSQEQEAEKIIADAQEKSKKNLEQAKINQDKIKAEAKENLQKEETELIATAQEEAEKQAQQIFQNKDKELQNLSKVDINKGTDLVVEEILNIK